SWGDADAHGAGRATSHGELFQHSVLDGIRHLGDGMFYRVNNEIGFNGDAVSHWVYALVYPPDDVGLTRRGSGLKATPQTGTWGGMAIHTLEPPVAALGWAPFTLHVHGNGFVDGAVIVWNGVDEVTTFVSATEVTTGVDMSTATTAMSIPVYVRN